MKFFPEIIGHDRIKQILTGILEHDRIPQAQLWVGPEGIGKAKLARLFARTVICTGPGQSPCGDCPACRRSIRQNQPDLIEIKTDLDLIKEGQPPVKEDGAISRHFSIKQIRDLSTEVCHGPRQEKYLVCLLPDADRLTEEAADCFLKLLEEPPARVIFLLTTAQPSLLPPTILSRCQILYFSSFKPAEAAAVLKQNGWDEVNALAAARFTLGHLALLEEKNFSERSLDQLFPGGLGRQPEKIFTQAQELSKPGADRDQNLRFLAWLILSARKQLVQDPAARSAGRIIGQLAILLDTYELLQRQVNQRLCWEATFLKLSRLEG